MGEKILVGPAADIAPGGAVIVDAAKRSVGVFNIDGAFYALLNVCPHKGAALCEGPVCGASPFTDKAGDFAYDAAAPVVRCAWHGWEFDIRTGEATAQPGLRARRFETSVEDGQVYVHL